MKLKKEFGAVWAGTKLQERGAYRRMYARTRQACFGFADSVIATDVRRCDRDREREA